jgi:hypothetical protein
VYAAVHELPLREYPVSHEAHLAPLLVHAEPIAGDPLLHLHVYVCWHVTTFWVG